MKRENDSIVLMNLQTQSINTTYTCIPFRTLYDLFTYLLSTDMMSPNKIPATTVNRNNKQNLTNLVCLSYILYTYKQSSFFFLYHLYTMSTNLLMNNSVSTIVK